MKKSYINPSTDVLTLAGTSIMLGASGDMHSDTVQGDQTQNHAAQRFGDFMF